MKIIIIFLLVTTFGLAQNQANTWYFGNGAGVKFVDGDPITLTNGKTYLQEGHLEGTAVMCDGKGELLFYTNGETIWNKAHVVMNNGSELMGSYSSAQSSLILPLPGSTNLFYVFTLDQFQNSLQNGFRYSVVDMCLDNKFGEVVSNQKNILIENTMGEQQTAVRHSNGIDYWVIVHKFYSNSFYAYLLSASGLSSTPVITNIGSLHTSTAPFPGSAMGTMKASPDGNRIGMVIGNGGHIREIFNFNKSTGVLSSFIDLHTPADINQDDYSCSFSPDNSKFYFTYNSKVWQYDLTAGGGLVTPVRNSKTLINGNSNSNNYALQLAPNGKIYVGEYGAPYLSVIHSPNLAGAACGFEENAVDLEGNNCSYGLPNFVDSFGYSNMLVDCLSDVNFDNEGYQDLKLTYIPNTQILKVNSSKIISNIELFNISGVVFYNYPISTQDAEINLNNLTNGVYFARINIANNFYVRMLSIVK